MDHSITLNTPQFRAESLAQLVTRISSKLRPTLNHLDSIIFPHNQGPFPNEIIEIIGNTNVGKTMLLMEIIAKTILPKRFGGKSAEVLYIETKNNFQLFKLIAILEKKIKNHITIINRNITNDEILNIIQQSLKNIIFQKCYTRQDFETVLLSLHQTISTNLNCALVILDSVDTFYWADCYERRPIKINTYLKNLLVKLRETINKNNSVLVYCRLTYFSTQLMEEVALTSVASVKKNEFNNDANYRIELEVDAKNHNTDELPSNEINNNYSKFIATFKNNKLNTRSSRRYTITNFGINWEQ